MSKNIIPNIEVKTMEVTEKLSEFETQTIVSQDSIAIQAEYDVSEKLKLSL